VNGNRGEINYC